MNYYSSRVIGVRPGSEAEIGIIARDSGKSMAEVRRAIEVSRDLRARRAPRPMPPRPVTPARATTPSPASTPYRRNAALAELAAAKLGRELGVQYNHDVYALCEAQSYVVNFMPGSELVGSTPYLMIVGRSMPVAGIIVVARDIDPSVGSREHTIAHEAAHCLGIERELDAADCERCCDAFARAFLEG